MQATQKIVATLLLITLFGAIQACPYIDGCSFDNSDCTSLTCQQTIFGKTIYFTIKLDTCKTDITATVTVEEYSSGISFTHTFKGEGDIPIPGLNFGSIGSANIRVKVYRNGNNLNLELDLVIKTFLSSDKSFTIINADLGYISNAGCGSSSGSGAFSWFNDQPIGVKAAIIAAIVVFVLGVIGCIACCCCCCKNDRSPGVVIARPAVTQVDMGDIPQASVPYNKF